MTPRFLLASLFALAACGSAMGPLHAQTVTGRNSNWTPYRPLHVTEHATPAAAEPRIKPSQYIVEDQYAPVYGEYISDMDLQHMRGSRSGYVMHPTTSPQIFVDPQTGNPFMSAQPASTGWGWELLPDDLLWHSYMAGAKEPRMSGVIFEELNGNMTLMDVTLGGRASILRYGRRINGRPCGMELQVEGAGQPRINLDQNWDLEAADFRFGLPLIYGNDRVQFKLSYYHLSSHLGDEYIERMGIPASDRINYARDAIVIGTSFFPLPAWRWYGEVEWAFYADEGADPWAFQFGVEYAQPGPTGPQGTPFFAVNGHLREEVDYGGYMVAQGGWLWRGNTGKMLRTGVHYHNGKSHQFAFNGPLDEFEQQIGAGLWYDY
jgi:hypothetical protein